MKKKINRSKLDKRNVLLDHEDEENLLQYHFHKYNKNKHSFDRNVYLAYKKSKPLNPKTGKLYDDLKDKYGITVVTNHSKCADPPDPIVKCEISI